MMRMRSAIAVMAVMIFACAPLARGAGQLSPAGLWQAVDSDTKEPTGWFLIADHNGIYDGIIARMFLKPGEDPNTVCDKCKDDRKHLARPRNYPWHEAGRRSEIWRRNDPRSARR
jgi:hypothetical protein